MAVLINAGLLALLFMIAINPEQERDFSSFEKAPLMCAVPVRQEKVEREPMVAFTKSAVEDEIDIALQDYADKTTYDAPKVPELKKEDSKEQQITITVKRGDMLERIARANGTTVQKLKQINQLHDEHIEVGQILRVPVLQLHEEIAHETKQNEEFYTIKSGDNPWKIAKQFNVRFDELLNLNHLDEEKARKLKAGDKIRVH